MDNKQLMETMRATRVAWQDLLMEVGEVRMTVPGVTGNWSVKDIVVHLTEWEKRTAARLIAVRQGGAPEPAPWPKNMTEEDENAWIYKANRDRTLRDVLDDSLRVHNQVIEQLQSITDEDLNTPGRFSWLAGNKLADYIPGNTYEHYQEHGELIRKWLAEQQA